MATRLASRGWLGLVLGGTLLGATPAAALDYSVHPKDSAEVNAILAKGRFDEGDTQDLKRYIAKLPKKASTVVYFNSPGGNLRESVVLGTYFYQNKIGTAVEQRAACASACAISFMGGRGADGKPYRVKWSSAKLGFHSFGREFPDDRRYSSDDMKTVLQRAQTEVGVLAEYLRTIDTDLDVLRIMLGATHSQMNFLSNDEALGLGIQVFDEKTNAMMDPAPALERLAKKRAEDRIASANPPAAPVTPADTPRTPRTATPGPGAGGSDGPVTPTATPRAPTTTPVVAPQETPRRATPRTAMPTPGSGGSDAPGVAPVATPRTAPTVRPPSTAERRPGQGIADSGARL